MWVFVSGWHGRFFLTFQLCLCAHLLSPSQKMIYILPFFNLAFNRRNTIDFDFPEAHLSYTRVYPTCTHWLTCHLMVEWLPPLTKSPPTTTVAVIRIWFKRKIYIPSARQISLKQHFSSFGSCPPHPTHFQNNEKAHASAHTTTNDHPRSLSPLLHWFPSLYGPSLLMRENAIFHYSALFRVHLSLRMRVATIRQRRRRLRGGRWWQPRRDRTDLRLSLYLLWPQLKERNTSGLPAREAC